MEFKELTMEDRAWVSEYLMTDQRALCEYTFAGNYCWRSFYMLQIARVGSCGIFRHVERTGKWNKNDYIYSFPFGGTEAEKKRMIELLMETCEKEGTKLMMSPLATSDKELLEKWYPQAFFFDSNRDLSDYIYLREKLVTLPGKKLHGKRNHIARFKDADDWCYESINDTNVSDAEVMLKKWKENRIESWNGELEREWSAMHFGLVERDRVGLTGGLLRKADVVVALALGEPLNQDTFVVHFEKAFADVQGAYPMINQQFAEHAAKGYLYVNREEDTGDAGLRKAKLSYQPDHLEEKYTALQSDISYANPSKDADAIRSLWQACFFDGDYVDYYMEHRMNEKNMLVIRKDGQIVSMASFLPAEYRIGEQHIPVRYVYAVGTMPKMRGQGLAAEILDFALDYWKEPLVLSPAEESLFDYYESCGFVRAFEGADISLKEKLNGIMRWNCCFTEADADCYATIREQILSKRKNAYLHWDTQAVSFALDLNVKYGGHNLIVSSESDPEMRELLMYAVEEDTLTVIETTLSNELLAQILPELMMENHVRKIRYEIPGGMIRLPEQMKNIVIPAEGYLNLTLG
ncbi:MAG: GNAT family N-acetyltransferase [bacterium]|nr:GNAT family N-acetyltransferase [bacterium]